MSSSRLPGFHRMPLGERRRVVSEVAGIALEALASLDNGGLSQEAADSLIENVIGRYALPFGIATNMIVNDSEVLVPMVVEEPSVVAAASHAAKLCRKSGGFRVEVSAPVMIAQVQIIDVVDTELAERELGAARDRILSAAREHCAGLVQRGGGPRDIEVRVLQTAASERPGMVVVHLLVDCCDAMGANAVNSIAEGVAKILADLAGGRVGLRVLSNLATHRTASVSVSLPIDSEEESTLADSIARASDFAELDPYRAATHNKGIMNGVDAVLVATGNDWRAAEAGAHAYAARSGRYRPLSAWWRDGDALRGTMTLPLQAGTVGGALQMHPGAQLALAILGTTAASDLSAVAAATGLASNLAALRALATEGIQRGHMSLHARVIARGVGAAGADADAVAAQMVRESDVRPARAREILQRLATSQHRSKDS